MKTATKKAKSSPIEVKKILSKTLERQIDQFIGGLEKYNQNFTPQRQRPAEDYKFLRDFYRRFFQDRNKRSLEITSEKYQEITKLANEEFPIPTFWVLCMDGRVLPVLISGASAHIGDSMRVPGGNIKEFVRGTDGTFKLLHDSNFARLLHTAFIHLNAKVITEVLDSHVGCAAVKGEEDARGRNPADGGLLHDILHKKEMAKATVDFVAEHFGNKKRALVIQTSFNPNNGFLYMGLETQDALKFAYDNKEKMAHDSIRSHNKGAYTKEVLAELIKRGKILSTESLAREEKLHDIFEKYYFEPDWREHYVNTAAEFWKAIQKMKKEASSLIEKKVVKIYKKADRLEIAQRCLLLLTNAFSGFLHNRHEYPHGIHREELIAVSEAGYTPHQISSFVVLGRDEKNLAANIELASGLVRKNRADKRTLDRSRNFLNPLDFTQAPIPMTIQEIVKEHLSNEQWRELEGIDWSDMPHNWDTLSDEEFILYLGPKGKIPISVALSINNLRKRMALLYDPDSPVASHLIAHHRVALPIVASKDRYNHFIIPFVKLGFN